MVWIIHVALEVLLRPYKIRNPQSPILNPMSKSPRLKPSAPQPGFYARAFRSGELADLDAVLAQGLAEEISMLRAATRRVIEYIGEFETPKEAIATLGALGLAATRLSTLIRTQKLLEDSETSTSAALSQALSEVVKELGIHD